MLKILTDVQARILIRIGLGFGANFLWFLTLVSEVEKFFDYIGIADDKQVCLMAFKLKGGASAW